MDDPHGIVEVFRSRYEANLDLMHPDTAARGAMAALDAYLKSSKFVDLSSKSTEGRHYIRVDRKPEEMRELRR